MYLHGPGLYGVGPESWRLGDSVPDLDGFADLTLTTAGERTRLVIETGWMPLDKVAFYGVGWQLHVEHLADHLAGRERRDEDTRWAELEPGYLDLAATLD